MCDLPKYREATFLRHAAYYPGSKEGHIPTRRASFDVALFGLFPEIGIGENGETLRNG
jgi:hypothetical protein